MILVFGGTTEGKRVAHCLEAEQVSYIYSTKTETDFVPVCYGQYRHGGFTVPALTHFIKESAIQIIIDASHPFASLLHETIEKVALSFQIPVIRFERNYPKRILNPLVHYVPSYVRAIELLNQHACKHLLALTGVQSIEKLKPYWQKNQTTIRILPRESSVSMALQADFPKENLLTDIPTSNMAQEMAIIQNQGIDWVLTKESGESGFFSTKIEAAIQTQTNVIVIERPLLPVSFQVVETEQELVLQLSLLYS